MFLSASFIPPASYLALLLLLLPVYLACLATYRLYFHPLARFPGPFFHRLSRIPYLYGSTRGNLPFNMLAYHQKYGNIVRIAPDELAFSHPDAWTDIMGHKKGSASELTKAGWFYRPIEDAPTHVVNETREQHGKLRRQLAHGFSEKSMREQEGTIQGYVDLLVECLRKKSAESDGREPVVISEWYNYCTFDIIGHLAFGESFGCLDRGTYDPWIKAIFEGGRIGTILQALSFLPQLKKLLLGLTPRSAQAAHDEHTRRTKSKMLRRIAQGNERPDLMSGLLAKQEELNLDISHLISNAEILIIGGSETTATLLSGVTYLLLRSPHVLDSTVREVREAFSDESEISLISVAKLEYMLAVLNEALRMYPPIANGLPRVTPREGAVICDEFVAGNMTVAVHQWALYRREEYFKDANEFHPERWLGNENYKHDRKDTLQPFHVGPRNCLGKNLAYSEMRLILARILYNFDLKLSEESMDWMEQRNFLMWEKGPLKLHLIPAR